MRYSLLCYLESDVDERISWVLHDRAGKVIDSAEHVSLSTLPPATHVLTLLIPSTACVLTSAQVPTNQRQRLIQAVPYALEEQFATDVENLHFALGERTAGEQIAVAVTTQALMQQWLTLFKNRGYQPQRIIPDVFAVPFENSQAWHIVFYQKTVLVRTGAYSGFSIEPANLQLALQLALQQQSNLPSSLKVYYQQDETPALTVLSGLGIPIEEQTRPDSCLTWLLQGLIQTPAINLLQGEYRPQDNLQALWKPWRLTAGLLCLLGGIYTVQQFVAYQALKQQQTDLNTQIETLYRQTFPDSKRIVNARVQMEQQLNQLKTQQATPQSSEAFLTGLTQLSPALKQAAGLNLKRIDYRQGRFDLELELANLQALEQLKQAFSQAGFAVELQSATSRENGVEARIRLQKS